MPNRVRMRRIVVTAVAALVAASFAASATAAFKLVPRASGFSSPVYAIGASGNRSDLYVVGQAGTITRLHHGKRNVFLDIRGRVGAGGGEEGLLSMAFHPRYAQNRRFFVYYTDNGGNLRVVEFRANAAGTRAVKSRARFWFRVFHPSASNHNGGQLQFGKSGNLYAATGDGGTGGDRARDLGSRLGKLLRLNVDKPGADPKIAAAGFRNPWRFSVDRRTGRFFIGDVGQTAWEEIDTFVPGRKGLENYGWNRFEGNHRHSSNPLGPGRYVRPIHEYAHSSGRCSVTGGFLVRGDVPGAGRYFYGDYCTGEVWSFRWLDGRRVGFRREAFTVPGNLSSFGLGPRGNLLAISHGGTVYRVARR